MARFLAALVLELLANSVGIIVASATVAGFSIEASAFAAALLIYSGVKILLGPYVTKTALRYVPAFRGGVALITTFVALLAAVVMVNGFEIRGVQAWLVGTLIVWLLGVLASLILPLFVFKEIMNETKSTKTEDTNDGAA